MEGLLNWDIHEELISVTKRILKLNKQDFRITDKNLLAKNPKYPICDVVLKVDYVYSIEHLLNLWINISKRQPIFIFKNNGYTVSLSCHLQMPVKIESNAVREINIININEILTLCMTDIEFMKPSSSGVLTKCIIRKSKPCTFIIEFISFGPENETEYRALMKSVCAKINPAEKKICLPIARRRNVAVCRKITSQPTAAINPETSVIKKANTFFDLCYFDYMFILFILLLIAITYVIYKGVLKGNNRAVVSS